MNEERFLKSEIATMEHFLAKTPPENVIEISGYQHRLAEAEARLSEMNGMTLEQKLGFALADKIILQKAIAGCELAVINIRRQIAFQDYGVQPGVIVLSKSGVRMRVTLVTPIPQNNATMRNEKPWVYAVPETHKRPRTPSPRLMFTDWELADK